jgi:hypothetical protein
VHHVTGTAKMGQGEFSVVDANLRVYGVKNLRIADGSIMPTITTGDTQAPRVIIGERMAEILKASDLNSKRSLDHSPILVKCVCDGSRCGLSCPFNFFLCVTVHTKHLVVLGFRRLAHWAEVRVYVLPYDLACRCHLKESSEEAFVD